MKIANYYFHGGKKSKNYIFGFSKKKYNLKIAIIVLFFCKLSDFHRSRLKHHIRQKKYLKITFFILQNLIIKLKKFIFKNAYFTKINI